MPKPITGPVTSVSFRDQMGFTVAHDGGTTFFVTGAQAIINEAVRCGDAHEDIRVVYEVDRETGAFQVVTALGRMDEVRRRGQ